MLLKVGELAKRTGMTVRMLHHYDSIGLLVPSARTDADYRLYNREDVARLHAIQALRQLGLRLRDISSLLAGQQEPLSLIVQRQITTLEHQIEQASELCARLRLLHVSLSQGDEPDMADWLSMLASMNTYGKYFSASELKKIFETGKQTEAKWIPLIAEIRNAISSDIAPTSLEIQPLARRWMDLSVLMMNGDFELMKRWEKMYLQEPATRGKKGDDLDIVLYINQAVELRVGAFLRYFTESELQSFDFRSKEEWLMLADEIKKIMTKNVQVGCQEIRDLVEKWTILVDRMTNHDAVAAHKFIEAFGADPILRAGSILGPESESFIRNAWLGLQKMNGDIN